MFGADHIFLIKINKLLEDSSATSVVPKMTREVNDMCLLQEYDLNYAKRFWVPLLSSEQ